MKKEKRKKREEEAVYCNCYSFFMLFYFFLFFTSSSGTAHCHYPRSRVSLFTSHFLLLTSYLYQRRYHVLAIKGIYSAEVANDLSICCEMQNKSLIKNPWPRIFGSRSPV